MASLIANGLAYLCPVQLPQQLLASLEGVKGFDRAAFEQVHQSGGNITSVRINPAKTEVSSLGTTLFKGLDTEAVPWTGLGYYLSKRPSFTFDPLFHAGSYYVQEASSMFLEQAMKQHTDLSQPLKVLDLSAAPGGKSTHLQSLISEQSLLVSNEVIRSRATILTDNIIKWGCSNVVVTNNDPAAFKKLGGYFDVIVVDAPCSGSGLFRKDPEAISEWSPNAVALCSQRQQRILADVLPSLKEDGLLVYSTCSFSVEEDEAIGEWLMQDMEMEPLRLSLEEQWGIVETEASGSYGYRFYPDKVRGEGFFLSCFRKKGGECEANTRGVKVELAPAKDAALIQPWLTEGPWALVMEREEYHALPVALLEDYKILRAVLNVQYRGTALGSIMKNKLVPAHALSQARMLAPAVQDTAVDYEQAIRYLQRGESGIEPPKTGWQTVSYKGRRLGWINALGNRINNYYPKELRILKQQNDSGFEN